MKKLLIIIVSVAQSMACLAQNDTLVINYPRKVTVVTGDSIQNIKIEGRHDDYGFRYENTIQLVDSNYISNVAINSDRWDFSLNPFGSKNRNSERRAENEMTMHLGVGWCTALGAPDHMDVEMGSSWEIFWTIAQWDYSPRGSRNTWSFGMGLDWRNYRMNGHWRFDKLPDDVVVIMPYPSEGISKQFSRVKVLSFHIPMLYSYHIGRGFSLSAGPVVYLNTKSSLKTRYKLDGQKYKETANGARVNPITVDLMGIIRTPAVSLYVKYSPCNVLKTDYAPKFQSFSVGIYL